MGIGPQMQCDKCGGNFYGGKGYDSGAKNFCHDCIVNMAESISEEDFNNLGGTQKGFIALVQKMGGIEAAGGKNHWSNMLKKNAGELEEIPVNTEDDVQYIMGMLEKFSKTYKDNDGHSLLVGGLHSYIYPEKYQGIADKHQFEKYKSFHISDKSILDEVRKYISAGRMVAVAAWTKEDKIDVWLERESANESKSEKESGGCFIATAVYGSYEAEQVRVLRDFRDKHLLEKALGRIFVEAYYATSPHIVQFIKTNRKVKAAIRNGILDPLLRSLTNRQNDKTKGEKNETYNP